MRLTGEILDLRAEQNKEAKGGAKGACVLFFSASTYYVLLLEPRISAMTGEVKYTV
jgi:hypothetical protein